MWSIWSVVPSGKYLKRGSLGSYLSLMVIELRWRRVLGMVMGMEMDI